ncbi:MAG: hypothetical protein A3F69_01495 [Acidobacteria bacterium RIFCSPLOWO2_12_FULL_66_10]|nr:MAG: hypothetical protein A3F69_01495 [Acidobacteria bacterium RIFCSPLOWO2_12_FULL_66_10]
MDTTERQRAIEALRTLPEHATIKHAIERLCFIAKIEEVAFPSPSTARASSDRGWWRAELDDCVAEET